MRTKKWETTRKLVDDKLKCDVCKKTITQKDMSEEYAILIAEWGYFSDGRDGEKHTIHFCQRCYEKMLLKMGINVNKIAESIYNGGSIKPIP